MNEMTIDEYIAGFPCEVQEPLRKLRAAIREAVPDAKERISWKMPTFWYGENLVHFAAAKKHIGFYPGPDGVEHFSGAHEGYVHSKGCVRFPLDKPIPFEAAAETARFRMKQAREKYGELQ